MTTLCNGCKGNRYDKMNNDHPDAPKGGKKQMTGERNGQDGTKLPAAIDERRKRGTFPLDIEDISE